MRYRRTIIEDIQVDTWRVAQDTIPENIVAGFHSLQKENIEFGLDWLSNLSTNSMPEASCNVLYTAKDSSGGLVALPLSIIDREARSLSNWYTSLYSPMSTCQQPATLFTAIFSRLTKERVDSLALSPLAENHQFKRDMLIGLDSAGWRGIHDWTCFTNWFQHTQPGGYADYLRNRPSRLRNTIKRRKRKFVEDGRGTFEIVTGTATLDKALEAYTDIYERSWKRNEPWQQFIPALVRLAAKRGWLRLGLACYDGTPIAAQIWLVANRTAAIFKLAYDPKYRDISPGTLLTAHLMEHVINVDSVTKVDYLTGNDAYKKDWMDESQQRIGIAAFNPRCWRGAAKLALHSAKSLT